jgi:hypothetical protein
MIDEKDVEVEETEIIQQDDLSADLSAAWEEEEIEDANDGSGGQEASENNESAHTSVIEGDIGTPNQEGAEDSKQNPTVEEGAPDNWSAEARESWKDVPAEAQAYIKQRERQVSEGMQKYASEAKRAGQMDNVLRPHSQYLAMNGGPGKAIEGLLQAGSSLQMGSPTQKAQTIAGLIQSFGIDISTLDNLLVGNAPPEGVQQNQAVQDAVNQAVAPYQQTMRGLQAREQAEYQRQQQETSNEVNNFGSTHEFYNDVRGDMADFLDIAAKHGQSLTMEDAYKKAVAMNPQISTIVDSRANANNLAQKRKAAASITGSLGGPGGKDAPNSLTDQLNAAWDAVGSR